MRADRLVALVLLLQVHGKLSVPALAERLEASERTVRRDLEALSLAGVPVYAERGRNGGWRLLGGHRIDLSGLTSGEAEALLVALDPGTVALGPAIAAYLAAARRKVLAALPEALRAEVEAKAARVLVDPTRWGRPEAVADRFGGEGHVDAHLDALRRAVGAGVQVELDYERPGRSPTRRRLHPHGLVCKRGVWYLVATAEAGLRTFRLSRVRAVVVTGDRVEQPADFDLAAVWSRLQEGLLERTPAPVVVEADVAGPALARLQATVGSWWPVEVGARDDEGFVRVVLRLPSPVAAASELAGLGDQIRVRSPEEVRRELWALGAGLAARYGPRPGGGGVVSGSPRRR